MPQEELIEVIEQLRELTKRQARRMRVYLFIFGVLLLISWFGIVGVYLAASGAKSQSEDNHRFGEVNRDIYCQTWQFVAPVNATRPEGC